MKSATTANQRFANIPSPEISRSQFNRHCGSKTTFDSGYLIPVFWDEVLPGDTVTLKPTFFARIATLLFPIMDNVFMDTFFFAVPNRLCWENWERFCGAQDNPGDSTDYEVPGTSPPPGGFTEQSVGDYFGLPTKTDFNDSVNAMPFRAMNRIYNEWFRDQNLVDSIPQPIDDGPDDPSIYNLLRTGKRHDYFTSSLPFAQKGDPVTLGLGGIAPVVLDAGQNIAALSSGGGIPIFNSGTTSPVSLRGNTSDTNIAASGTAAGGSGPYNLTWNDARLSTEIGGATGTADLTGATAISVNQLRTSIALQQMLERAARGGTRYTEIIRSFFSVTSPDARLQRSEYLGGTTQPLMTREVPATVDLGSPTSAQAQLAAYGTITVPGGGFRKSFTEHCYILGFVRIRADLNYQQGILRGWSRKTKYDFFWPDLARLGEQNILNQEIYVDGSADDAETFSYQERYAEYRYKPNQISGRFRSNAAQPLDAWHLAQEFANRPVLDETFIEENPPIDRIIAIQTEPQFIMDCYFNYTCARPIPVYGVPGLTRL